MALLNLFLHKPSLTLSELVSLTGMPKTSVHRMVSSLEEMGFLSRDASGAYSLGLVFWNSDSLSLTGWISEK